MKGNNTLVFSHATMVEAIQQYLDNQFRDGLSPIVEKIKEVSNNGIEFHIDTAERDVTTVIQTVAK